MDAFNDLQYSRADSIAHQVLGIPRISSTQRTNAQLVIAAAAYPEEASAQRRSVALAMLKQIVRANLNLKIPQELAWAGLDSLVDEAKLTTFALEVTATPEQTTVGPDGMAKLSVRSNKPGIFRLMIVPAADSGASIVDSIGPVTTGEISFRTMRDEKPLLATGDYSVIIVGYDPVDHDSVTVQYTMTADAPALTFATLPTKMDSSKLLKERSGRAGAKSIFPALLVGGAAFILSSSVRGAGNIATQVATDSKGVAVGGVLMLSTIIAGFTDHGRVIPANIAANKATGEAFQKSIIDAQAENRRRIAEYKTVLTFNMEQR